MLNFADITRALEAQLKADAVVGDYLVERAQYVNDDPAKTPWVGVYRGSQSLDPRVIGSSKTWLTDVDITVVVQAASLKDGKDAEDKLQEYEQAVLNAIESDRKLGGTVQMITGYNVAYDYQTDERKTHYMQSAIITVSAETKTGG